MGDQGVLWLNGNQANHFPARKVNVTDSTGAGDAFSGAFASRYCQGYSTDDAIRFANIAASISVTRMGAQSSMPTLKEVENLLEINLKSTGDLQ